MRRCGSRSRPSSRWACDLLLSARSLRLLTEERNRQAHTDELTGLGNRRQLGHGPRPVLRRSGQRRASHAKLAFLFVDLNHFKEINDSFGHPAGDELLAPTRAAARRAVGSPDSVVRLGGDELAVVLMDADADDRGRGRTGSSKRSKSPSSCTRSRRAWEPASASRWCPPTQPTDRRSCGVRTSRCIEPNWARCPYVFYDQELDGGEDQPDLLDELREAVTTATSSCTISRNSTCDRPDPRGRGARPLAPPHARTRTPAQVPAARRRGRTHVAAHRSGCSMRRSAQCAHVAQRAVATSRSR